MEIDWPNRKKQLKDSVEYACPARSVTWEDSLHGEGGRCDVSYDSIVTIVISTNCDLHLAQAD